MKLFALLVLAFAHVTISYAQKSFGFAYRNEEKKTVITTVFKNGPADKAGMKTGDVVITINATSLNALNLDAVSKLISEADDNCLMSLMRNGTAINNVKIKRAERNTFLHTCISGNCQNGEGEFIDMEGLYYQGSFKNGVRTGYGKMVFFDEKIYTGNWLNNKPTGKGKEVYRNGNTYEGDFVNGMYEGTGTYTNNNGETYTGVFAASKFNGTIKHTLSEGIFIEVYKNGELVSTKKEEPSAPVGTEPHQYLKLW